MISAFKTFVNDSSHSDLAANVGANEREPYLNACRSCI